MQTLQVRTNIFRYLDQATKTEARLVSSKWNEEILGWAGVSVIVDELNEENCDFLQCCGFIQEATIKSLKFDPETTNHVTSIIHTAIFNDKVGPNALRSVFQGQRLWSIHLRERFIHQGFTPGYFMKSPQLTSVTLRELRLSLPFLGRPRVKCSWKLSRDISLLLNNIWCPNLKTLLIQETESVFVSKRNRAILSFQRLAIDDERCWDKDALRNFLHNHRHSLRQLSLSPVRNFPFSSSCIEFPRQLNRIHLDVVVNDLVYNQSDGGYWSKLLSAQQNLQAIRFGVTWLNSQPHPFREQELTWPQALLVSAVENSDHSLEHVSIQCSGCKQRKARPFLDLTALQTCYKLQNLFLQKAFVEGESYRIVAFPTMLGVDRLPISIKKIRFINLFLTSSDFLSLTRLVNAERIYWTLLPRCKFMFITPQDLIKFFHLRRLNSLNFPIDMEAYDLLVNNRVICNIYHTAEIGAENEGIATEDIEI